jgi:acetyltransferase-like isoleucine patch superfamily enzyme
MEALTGFYVGKGGAIRLGKQVHLRRGCDLEAHEAASLVIGDRFFANKGCSIIARQEITIGSDCMLGEYVTIYDHNHGHSSTAVPFQQQGYVCRPVKIGDNVWIGTKVFIGPGVTIGDAVVIGAHTIVTKDIPPRMRVYGRVQLVMEPIES